jgi:hypothetical protein
VTISTLSRLSCVCQSIETIGAARAVIGTRVALMVAAAQDPLSGDYADVLRMLASREALSEAGFGLVEHVGRSSMTLAQPKLSYVSRALTAAGRHL